MSDSITRARSWELATVRKSKTGKVYLSFGKDVSIRVGEREVDMGEFNTLFLDDAVENLNFLLEKEYIDQEAYNTRLQTIEDKGIKSIVKAKLV